MDDGQQEQPLDGPAAFLFMLLGNAADARKKLDEVLDKVSAPTVDVRLPMAFITRMVDNVACECDMCIGTLMWAKSINTSKLDDQLQRLLELSIANAEIRLLSRKQSAEYKRIYGHNPD